MDVAAYYRVSTKGQGESGLGIDAQQEYVRIAAEQQGWTVVAEYTDIGVSGSVHPLERPEAAKAFAHGLPVVVAKLDRLSRRVSHIAALMETHQFKVATMPTADTFQLHIYAVLAEQERTFVSERTKAALASLQARAEAGDAASIQKINNRTKALEKGRSLLNRQKGHDTQRTQADERAVELKDKLELCIFKGASTLQALANCLNESGVVTARGGKWAPTSVKRVMDRLSLAFPA
ncbi:recombinase family protein [Pseudomonas citronellolis]|uniref:recombinase family protein n=1 Tax=Pseudomonas citronellolis TaxID=53408 RepID=UPI0026477586|nr:recombinase family protein [Pseudomonas citronellolis]MDN6871847.1 recombinase family protein [Pseudomonas citronellolis]